MKYLKYLFPDIHVFKSGHNHQWEGYITTDATEVSCNWFSVFIMESVNHIPYTGTKLSSMCADVSRQAIIQKKGLSDISVWEHLNFYMVIKHAFGWKVFQDLLTEYVVGGSMYNSLTELQRIDPLITKLSIAAGHSLVPWADAWAYPITNQTRDAVAELPLWDYTAVLEAMDYQIMPTYECYIPSSAKFTEVRYGDPLLPEVMYTHSDYRGNVNITINGHKCQRWDMQTPNSHGFSPDDYPCDGLHGGHNYCRLLDEARPWCYTVDGPRWEFCDIPQCEHVVTATPTVTPSAAPNKQHHHNFLNSEIYIPTKMGGYSSDGIITAPTECPYADNNLVPFGHWLLAPAVAGDSITVTAGTRALLSAATTPVGVINRITIESGAALIFADENIVINVREIFVDAQGELLIGSENCRMLSNITIIFHGSQADSSATNDPSGVPSKGLIAMGIVDIHGAQFHPTWTRLGRVAWEGSTSIYLQDQVNWRVGQNILIVTTVYRDCPDEWKDEWCDGESHQNEVRQITSVNMNAELDEYEIVLDKPLTFTHYAGKEYQGEIALLSRTIRLIGVNSNDGFGGHTMIMGSAAEGRFRGVQGDNMGQLNVLGRYPFHFHMMKNASDRNSYFEECSVTNSNFRGYVIHGSNYTTVRRNVAFNVKGSCFYLEDGVEEHNTLEFNLAAHVSPIYRPANGWYGQGGEYFSSISGELLIPTDTSASGFYISNAMNRFVGNAASGGWSGFAFPNIPKPLGNFRYDIVDEFRNPMNRPVLVFYGNTAHSAGHYWVEHGSCIYVGAWLEYNTSDSDVLEYWSGRHARDVYLDDGTWWHMVFENIKVFLCNKGVAHWGQNVMIDGAEFHDVRVGAMMFGDAALHNAVINLYSDNPSDFFIQQWQEKIGFQFYDTWVQVINCNMY